MRVAESITGMTIEPGSLTIFWLVQAGFVITCPSDWGVAIDISPPNGRFGNLGAAHAAPATAFQPARSVVANQCWMCIQHDGDPRACMGLCPALAPATEPVLMLQGVRYRHRPDR